MDIFTAIDHEPEFSDLSHLTDHLERIAELRGRLLADIAASVRSLQGAADTLSELRSNTVFDVDFIDGRDGRDIATLLDETIRDARATYAIVHAVIDKGVPR